MAENEQFIMMTMPGKLVLRANGVWEHDGSQVTHPGLVAYLFKHLTHVESDQQTPAAGNVRSRPSFVIAQASLAVPVTVEDTAYFVRTIDTNNYPWQALLSDYSREIFLPTALRVDSKGEFFITVREGRFEAKLLRAAWQAILPFIVEELEPTSRHRYALELSTGRVPIEMRS